MLSLSVVPGRIRLESGALLGKRRRCLALAGKIRAIEGVIQSIINPRTGRILIRFDESNIDCDTLIVEVTAMLRDLGGESNHSPVNLSAVSSFACNRCLRHGAYIDHGNGNEPNGNRNGREINDLFIQAVVDIAGHVLMPKPFGILLPFAISAMRKTLQTSRGG